MKPRTSIRKVRTFFREQQRRDSPHEAQLLYDPDGLRLLGMHDARVCRLQDDVGPNAAIGGQNDGEISRAFNGLHAFGKVDFAGLGIGQWDYLRTNSVSR